VVERHGGRIWLKSAEGQGSSFYIELPSDPMARDEAGTAVAGSSMGASTR